MTSRPLVELGDCIDLQTGFPFKSARFLDESNAGVRLLRGDNVAQGRLRWDGAKHWPSAEHDQHRAFDLLEGDVILAMDRPWIEAGLKWAWVSQADLPCLLVQRVARMRGTNGLSTHYLRYVIGSPEFVGHVRSITTGVNVPHISGRDIKRFRFQLPSLADQERIASILGAYDDLIEVNRRRIAVLEEMARRLFEEWFVHFRFPGHKSETRTGELPSAWSMVPLDEMLVLQRGFDLPSASRSTGPHPVIAASGLHGTHSEFRVKGPGVVTGRSGTLGTVNLIHEDFWPLNTTLYVREFRRAQPAYALHLLRRLNLGAHGGGAAVPTLNRNHVHALQVPCPPSELVEQFEQHSMTSLLAVRNIERQNDRLAASRDLLLPRLISGDLPITAAERELEAIA